MWTQLRSFFFEIPLSIVLCIFFMGCIEHTLIPGQMEQQGQISRGVPPKHTELLQGGLLQQKIASQKLANRLQFLAFYPLHLVALGNFVERGEQEKTLPYSEVIGRSRVVSEERKQYKIRKMLASKEQEKRELAVGLIEKKSNFFASLYNENDYVRLAALHTLKKYSFYEIKSYLRNLLHDSNKFVRLETLRVLQFFPTKVILPYAYQALLDEESIVREEALDVIFLLKSTASITKLWKMLDDPEIYIRKKAVSIIEELTQIKVIFPYNGTPKIRKNKLNEWKKKWEKEEK